MSSSEGSSALGPVSGIDSTSNTATLASKALATLLYIQDELNNLIKEADQIIYTPLDTGYGFKLAGGHYRRSFVHSTLSP